MGICQSEEKRQVVMEPSTAKSIKKAVPSDNPFLARMQTVNLPPSDMGNGTVWWKGKLNGKSIPFIAVKSEIKKPPSQKELTILIKLDDSRDQSMTLVFQPLKDEKISEDGMKLREAGIIDFQVALHRGSTISNGKMEKTLIVESSSIPGMFRIDQVNCTVEDGTNIQGTLVWKVAPLEKSMEKKGLKYFQPITYTSALIALINWATLSPTNPPNNPIRFANKGHPQYISEKGDIFQSECQITDGSNTLVTTLKYPKNRPVEVCQSDGDFSLHLNLSNMNTQQYNVVNRQFINKDFSNLSFISRISNEKYNILIEGCCKDEIGEIQIKFEWEEL